MEVHRQLGCGFLEPVYQAALAREFESRGIPFQREVELEVVYKGKPLGVRYKPDFICFGGVIVELKALDRVGGIEESQIINYLKATGYQTGLLLNFGRKSLEFRRFIFSQSASSA